LCSPGELTPDAGGGAIPPHVRGRLAAAAWQHGVEIAWLASDDTHALARIHVDEPGPRHLIAAGRAAQRVWLEATSLGLAADVRLPADGLTDPVQFTFATAATRSR
jgi:hypothetical protein